MSDDAGHQDDPGQRIVDAVDRCLALARTWLAWDGRPLVTGDGGRIYTPHKAVRRIGDHLVDHLAETEALLAGEPTDPDRWHASAITLDADWARFTEADVVEAEQRLRRLARTYALRLRAAGPAEWDAPRDGNRTLRQTAEHVCGVLWYAEQVGHLSPARFAPAAAPAFAAAAPAFAAGAPTGALPAGALPAGALPAGAAPAAAPPAVVTPPGGA